MLELLFSFKGRVNRTGFWIISLVIMVGAVIASIIDRVTTDEEVGIATALYVLITLWPSLAIQAKRWHDRDKSAWWILINIIPIIGPLWALIENGFLAGTEGSNRFDQITSQASAAFRPSNNAGQNRYRRM